MDMAALICGNVAVLDGGRRADGPSTSALVGLQINCNPFSLLQNWVTLRHATGSLPETQEKDAAVQHQAENQCGPRK